MWSLRLWYTAPWAALLPAPKIHKWGDMDNKKRFEE